MEIAHNEFARLTHVAVKHARDAFGSQERLAGEWQAHGFTAPPDFARACDEYDAFLDALTSTGAALTFLPADGATTIDSIYVRDASLQTPSGLVLASMGKPLRAGEPEAQRRAFDAPGNPAARVIGAVRPPGLIEGGDVVWFDDRTVAVGIGYRTNVEGARQFASLLGGSATVHEVPLPHWHGPGDVMHLMSLLSPVDADLAVVYSRLLPVPFRQWLLERGITPVETPDDEFSTMGTNVLALAPRHCLMMSGNPLTRAALERAGATVVEYDGREISFKGGGGPTCLTRPLARVR
jgi:N-dimethylarginine dimethylaminohydrolase